MTISLFINEDEWKMLYEAMRYMLYEEEFFRGHNLDRLQECKDTIQHLMTAYHQAIEEWEGK